MNQTISASPHMKSDKPYSQSPGFKRQHPFNGEASVSLKNSINLKDLQMTEEMEYYKNRCQDLESYVRQLKNELDTTIIRLSKQGALDEKVELVLRQNQILSQDLDKIQKNFAQKKTECDLWKTKYEQQLNAAVQLKATYDLDLRKIHNELKQLEERNQILERERNHDVEATKTNLSIQNEQQRHNYLSQIDMLDNSLRKVRDYADQRDKELYELENKYNILGQDREIIENRLIKELETLRSRLQEQERDHSVELNSMRQKLDILNQGQMDNIKKQYLTQVDIMDNEIDKLKGLLDIKNTEIETLIIQNQRLRANYDEEVQTIRMQFDILKEKMFENEQQFQIESEQMENKIKQQYESDITQLTNKYQNQIAHLEQQIQQLRKQNELSSNEIQSIQKDRIHLIENHTRDKANQQEQIDNLFNELKQADIQKSEQILNNHQQYESQTKSLQEHIQQLQKQIEFQNNQINNNNAIIDIKDQEQLKLINTYQIIKTQLDQRLLQINTEYENLTLKLKQQSQQSTKTINDLTSIIEQLKLQIKSLTNQANIDKNRILQLTDTLKNNERSLTKQINDLNSQVQQSQTNYAQLELELKNTQDEYSQQNQSLLADHQHLIEQLNQQHQQNVKQLNNQIETMSAEYNTQLSIMQGELKSKVIDQQDLEEKLQQLEGDLQSILENPNDKIIQSYQLRSEIKLTQQIY